MKRIKKRYIAIAAMGWALYGGGVSSASALDRLSDVIAPDQYGRIGGPGQKWLTVLDHPRIKTNQPIPADRIEEATAPVKLTGVFRSSGVRVNVEIPADLKGGRLLPVMTPSELDTVLSEWSEFAGGLWDRVSADAENLQFEIETGLVGRWKIQSRFSYRMPFQIPYRIDQKKLELQKKIYLGAEKFILHLEKDKRARVVLRNNKTGQLPFIIWEPLPDRPEGAYLVSYPMNKIKQVGRSRSLEFDILGVAEDLTKIPEVRRGLKDRHVRESVGSNKEHLRVRFSTRQNQSAHLTFMNQDKSVQVKVTGRRVTPVEK